MNRGYEAREPLMAQYVKVVKAEAAHCDSFVLEQIVREDNVRVASLSKLGSSNYE